MSHELPTVVFVHGLTDDSQMWTHQVERLTDCARPVTVDLLEPETVGDAADLILGAVDGPFALAGFSMGGYVAFEVLRRAPDRVAKLALLSTSARADTPERAANRVEQITLAQSGGYEDLLDELLPLCVHASRTEDPTLMGELHTMARRVGAEAYVRQQRIIQSRPDNRDDLAAIRCPTLVVCGRDDTITPPDVSHEMAAGIPGARLALIDDCGHYASMERPYAVTSLLQQWLRYD